MASRRAGPSEGSRLLSMVLKEQKWSQTELARRIGVAEPTVGRWLRGERRPDAQSITRIEMVTSVPARMWGLDPFVSVEAESKNAA